MNLRKRKKARRVRRKYPIPEKKVPYQVGAFAALLATAEEVSAGTDPMAIPPIFAKAVGIREKSRFIE